MEKGNLAPSTPESLIPRGCHGAITESNLARRDIVIVSNRLEFGDQPGKVVHSMAHQSGSRVKDAAGEQLRALALHGGARELGRMDPNVVSNNAFAGAHLAVGRIMSEEGQNNRRILDEFLDARRPSLIGAAASIGVTLSILKGNELGAFLAKLLKEHGEDLRGKNSTLRKWILSAAPFRAQLLGVYRSAIELGDQDELAWTIGRLRALPISLDKRTLPDAQRESLLEWAGGLADALGRKAVVSIVDPIAGDTVNVAKFAQELRDRSIR